MLNILSLISFANAVFLMFICIYAIVTDHRSPINQSSALECFLLAVWAFAYTFMYVAPTKEAAWFWYKIGSIGWSGFMGVLVWFFLELSRHNWEKYRRSKIAFVFVFPSVLIILNSVLPYTCAAVDLKQSVTGMGWTYVNHISNPLLWVYLIYIFVGIWACIKIIHNWLHKTKSRKFKNIATAFFLVDGITILIGFTSDIIIPLVTDLFPPMTNIFLIIFSFGYWVIIFKLGVFEKTTLEASEFILNTISDALFVLDKNGIILHCNQAASVLLQYDIKDIVGKELVYFYKEGNYNPDNVNILFTEKKFIHKETELVAKDNSIIHTTYSASVAEDNIHGFVGIVISFHDVTKQKQLENKLYELAHYDALTGLPNRRYFIDMLYAYEELYMVRKQDFALLYMDLDGFKNINDTMGHDKGDLLLIEVGKRISDCINDNDMVARIGGDEFVMVQANVENEEQVENRKRKILEQFKEEFMIAGQNCPIGVSIGYTIYSSVSNVPDLMREADQRMYMQKMNKRK